MKLFSKENFVFSAQLSTSVKNPRSLCFVRVAGDVAGLNASLFRRDTYRLKNTTMGPSGGKNFNVFFISFFIVVSSAKRLTKNGSDFSVRRLIQLPPRYLLKISTCSILVAGPSTPCNLIP